MIHFKEQEKFVKIPSLRAFQPSKLFVGFVNFNKFSSTSANTSSFKWDFSISLHCCCLQLSLRTSASSDKERM